MRSTLRSVLFTVVAAAVAAGGVAHAVEPEGPAGALLVLHADGSTMSWSPSVQRAASAGATVALTVDTTSIAGVRSDVVRLGLALDVGAASLTTPSPFGGDERLAAVVAGPPVDAYVQVGRRVPIAVTFTEPGPHHLTVVAAIPGRSGPLEATTDLVLTTAAPGPPTPVAPVDAPATGSRRLEAAGPVGSTRPSATAQSAGAPVVISEGHVDMGPRIIDGVWRIQLKDDTTVPAVWRDLADVVLHAVEASRSKVPAGSQFEFLGPAGSDLWLLPQAQQQGIVWPGWNTQDPSVTSVATGPVTWRLLAVDGPGSFALFLTGSFGAPEVIFDSDVALPQQHPVALGTHVHGNWAFTRAGTYRLEVEMSAPTASGRVTDTRTLTFAVGAADPGQGSVTTTTTSAQGGASQEVTTSRGASGGGPGATGSMADTGAGLVVPMVVVGLGLVGIGTALLGARRRKI